MKYEVIDNFLNEEYFNELVTLFMAYQSSGMPWFYNSNVAGYKDSAEHKSFYMTHILYQNNVPSSEYYKNLIPLLEKLGVECLLRVKANLYPNTHILHEHPMHTDYDYFHTGAILSLNTCDGYTKLKDGTKIDSVANRVLLFDASEEHCSTTTSDQTARFNINLNFINEQNRLTKRTTI